MAGTFAAGAATGFVVGAAVGAAATAYHYEKKIDAQDKKIERLEAKMDGYMIQNPPPQNNFAQTTTVQVGGTAMRK